MRKNIIEKIKNPLSLNSLLSILLFSSLLFVFSPLPNLPWGSGWRYLEYFTGPVSLIIIISCCLKGEGFRSYFRPFLNFIFPFLPFMGAYLIVFLSHLNGRFEPVTLFSKIFIIVLLNGCVYALFIRKRLRVNLNTIFVSCGLGAFSCFLYCAYVYLTNNTDVWHIRPYLEVYPTIFARCISILGGFAFIGAFSPHVTNKGAKVFLFIVGLLSFITSVGFLGVRATVLVPFFALFSIALIVDKQKKFFSKFIVPTFAVLVLLIAVTPFNERLKIGIAESNNAYNPQSTAVIIEKIKDGVELSSAEREAQKQLNNSMGARFAVWQLALSEINKSNFWTGTGIGSPSGFVNTKELFSYSKDYLPHFHSDYVQCFVLGGFILTFGLIVTQFLLFIRNYKKPLNLFLLLSLLSFGIIDLGFIETKAFTCFMGIWMLLGLFFNRSETEV